MARDLSIQELDAAEARHAARQLLQSPRIPPGEAQSRLCVHFAALAELTRDPGLLAHARAALRETPDSRCHEEPATAGTATIQTSRIKILFATFLDGTDTQRRDAARSLYSALQDTMLASTTTGARLRIELFLVLLSRGEGDSLDMPLLDLLKREAERFMAQASVAPVPRVLLPHIEDACLALGQHDRAHSILRQKLSSCRCCGKLPERDDDDALLPSGSLCSIIAPWVKWTPESPMPSKLAAQMAMEDLRELFCLDRSVFAWLQWPAQCRSLCNGAYTLRWSEALRRLYDADRNTWLEEVSETFVPPSKIEVLPPAPKPTARTGIQAFATLDKSTEDDGEADTGPWDF